MPYIPQARRERIREGQKHDQHDPRDACPQSAGELNYLFFAAALHYLETHGTSYLTLNDIVGAYELSKQEFIRRVVAPYEDEAINRNGDVVQ
jgi:hypothetical protein